MKRFEENQKVNQTLKIDFQKTFSCTPDRLHVSSGNLLSRLSNARELGNISGWLETWGNLPLWFDTISWNSPELFIEFICSSISFNWEASCWMVFRDLLLIFESRTRQLVALALSASFPFRAYFGSAYLEELSPCVTIPLAIEFVLDENQQIRLVHPAVPCFVPPFVL